MALSSSESLVSFAAVTPVLGPKLGQARVSAWERGEDEAKAFPEGAVVLEREVLTR